MSSWRLYFRRRPQTIGLLVMFVVLFGMVLLLSNNNSESQYSGAFSDKYLYQQSYLKYNSRSTHYNISVVADKDRDSKSASGWGSVLFNGALTRDTKTGAYSVDWFDQIHITSKINEDGRGMELSDLTYFNQRLYSFDDRTGIVYEIDADKSQVIARYILGDGNGRNNKGFKCEWSTVKDGVLYVGGLGKEWTNPDGEVKSRDPQYIKTIDTEGRIEHISWVHVFEALREATGYASPGYLIHEAVRFNPVNRRWYFMPRRASKEVYNDAEDERRGANIAITTNEYFEDIQFFDIGPKIPTHGFSAFAFVPYREHEVVALKTEEVEGTIATYITVFDFNTKEVLLEETKIGDVKFEGVEFL